MNSIHFPQANVLTLADARARYMAGRPVTVTRTQAGTVADWAFATVARVNGRACERCPGRRLRFQSADRKNPLVAFALALLDSTDRAYTDKPKASAFGMAGVYLLSPARCTSERADGTECGDVLTTPRSIAEGRGPTCGGRYAAMRERADAKRAIVEAAWSAVLPAEPVATVAPAPACNGRCPLDVPCPVCG